MRALRSTALGAVVVLAACTSPAHPRHPDGTATSATGTVSARPTQRTSSAYVPPAGLLRTPPETEIGDPVTADLCAAIRLSALPELGDGLTPSFDARQFPPGCSITVRHGTDPVLELSVFARRGPSRTATVEHHSRTVSGRTVLVFAFEPKTGSCRRVLVAGGARLVVDAFPAGSEIPSDTVSCTGTDALANQLATAVAGGELPRLPSAAAPAIGELNACAVAERAELTALPAFAGSRLIVRGFGANCELARGTDRFLFVNAEIATTARPPGATPVSVGGHRFFEITSQPNYCAYASAQAATDDGRYERLAVSSTVVDAQSPPARLCAQTAQALARYLTAAGLE